MASPTRKRKTIQCNKEKRLGHKRKVQSSNYVNKVALLPPLQPVVAAEEPKK